MYNAQNKKLVSKRHARRIIANNIAIDIAGSSGFDLNESSVNTSNVSVDLDLHGDKKDVAEVIWNAYATNTNIPTSSVYDSRSQDNNIQVNSNEYHNSIIKKINNTDDNDDHNDNNHLRNALATWAISNNITHNACNALLKLHC
ncbi:rho-related protein racO-like [Harpegnathos saltator]|uniref:rho-related protein racO-like n=1 Tax=Harpegnathos saltator TaxID=610380 RepID=UPI000DBEE4A8|nr:rho-related protein racO-like [Harpegnathos saltator]